MIFHSRMLKTYIAAALLTHLQPLPPFPLNPVVPLHLGHLLLHVLQWTTKGLPTLLASLCYTLTGITNLDDSDTVLAKMGRTENHGSKVMFPVSTRKRDYWKVGTVQQLT